MKKISVVLSLLLAGWMAGCSSGPQIALDPDSETFLEYARLIMTGEEKDIFSHLPDAASRQEFIEEFWRKRDSDPYTEENEFKTEFYNRIDYANRRFREGIPGWKTDRGRIYIYMGPPDKFDEFFTHDDPDIRGPILWWIYYKYELGIEFVDVNNNGSYKIRRYDGSFTDALDSLMLGQVPTEKGEKRKFVNFKLDYDKERKEIVIAVPADAFNFKEEGGNLRAELEFEFFAYAKNGSKIAEFKQGRTFSEAEDKILQMKEMTFTFPFTPEAAEVYLDVIIIGKDGSLGKTRKIFKIKA